MTTDGLHPSDLKEGLGVVPLTYLVPKQDVASMIAPKGISATCEDFDIWKKDGELLAPRVRRAVNDDPCKYKDVIEHMAREFRDFDDEELGKLVFKQGGAYLGGNGGGGGGGGGDSVDKKNLQPKLEPLDQALFDSMPRLRESELVLDSFNTKADSGNFGQLIGDVPSIEGLDNDMQSGNKKYRMLFEEERSKFLSTRVKLGRDHLFSSPVKRDLQDEKGLGEAAIEEAPSAAPEVKRPHKSAQTHRNEVSEKAMNDVTKFLQYVENLGPYTPGESYRKPTKDGESVLSLQSLIFIFECLLKMNLTQSIKKIEIDHVISIQRYCMRLIAYTASLDITPADLIKDIESRSSLPENQDHTTTTEYIFSTLIAIKNFLVIINRGRNENHLYSDENLKLIVNLVYTLIQEFLIPASTTNTTPALNQKAFIDHFFTTVLVDLEYIFRLITAQISGGKLDEYVLTKIEYVSTALIFLEFNPKERDTLIGNTNFNILKLQACRTLSQIFKTYADQKHFILNEIMSNFDRLPPQKLVAKQFKLTRGGNVQLITVLLITLVQTHDLGNVSDDAFGALKTPDNPNDDLSVKSKRQSILELSVATYRDALQTANEIVTFLMNKLANNPDSHRKHLFEMLLDDLLNVLLYPEWPGAELLVVSVFKSFLSTYKSGIDSTVLEAQILELASVIGARIFSLKKRLKASHQFNLNSSIEDIAFYSSGFLESLQYVLLQVLTNVDANAAAFLTVKLISALKPILHPDVKNHDQLEALNSEADDQGHKTIVSDVNTLYDNILRIIVEGHMNLSFFSKSNQEATSTESYAEILATQELPGLFDSFLNIILRALDSKRIKSRTRAIKTLSTLIEIDSNLLVSPQIQQSVARRLHDTSPLVRDAVIDLISRFLLSKPEVIHQFHAPISDSLNDESVQVRKRVLKIAKDMYLKVDSRLIKVQIATKILRRLDDEDDVISDLVVSYLLELWFRSLIKEIDAKDLNTVATATLQSTEIMMDIVGSGGKNALYLEKFLVNSVLLNNEQIIVKCVSLMIDKVLDFVIDCVDTKYQLEVEKALLLICTFVKHKGKLLNQTQLISLQPLLVNEKNTGGNTCYYSLQILKHVLPGFTVLRPEFTNKTQMYLLKMLTKFSTKELYEAMPCVWRLSKMKNDTSKLANASISCMKLIRPFMDKSKKGASVESATKLQRLLNLLGCFGKFCKFEKHRDSFLESNLGMKDNETVMSLITKFLLYFCGSSFDATIRKVGIKNTINLCSSHPKLFMSDAILKVIDREFNSGPIDIKLSIIQGFMEFLSLEDAEAQRRNGADQKSSNNIKLDVAVFHGDALSYMNDAICAALIQRYLQRILDLCLYDDGEVSMLPVQYVQLVVKLGYSNPKICMPYIIALESSENLFIRRTAFELHKELFEKYESLTDTSYLEGIKKAVRYRKTNSKNLYRESFYLKLLYSIVAKSYSSRKKFVILLSKIFTVDLNHTKLETNTFQRDCIIYTALNLATVRFASLEDVLILIHSIDKVLSRQGIDLADTISLLTKTPSTEISTPTLRNMCVNAQAMLGLITLRNHLMAVHNITRSQLESYLPTRVELEFRQPPKITAEVPIALETEDLNSNLKLPDRFTLVFTKFTQAIHEFT